MGTEFKTHQTFEPKNPSSGMQFLLAIVLCVFCGITIMMMWNWYVVPLGLPAIGLVQALGLDMLVTFIVTTQIDTKRKPFWDRWITSFSFAIIVLFYGWILHFFM